MTAAEKSSKDKILEKIRRLKAAAEAKRAAAERGAHSEGTMEEAEAFAAKLAELLARHKIDMKEVELAELDQTDPMGTLRADGEAVGFKQKARQIAWQRRLADIVARNHFCRTLVSQGTNTIWFVGRESDREVAVFLYAYLVQTMETFCNREYDRIYHNKRREGTAYEMRGWKKSFYDGALNSLSRRLRELRRSMEQEGSGANALIKLADGAVDAYVDKTYPGKAKRIGSSTQEFNPEGWHRGKEYGENVQLRRGVKAGESPAHRGIGRGSAPQSRQLGAGA
jgi:hypothetical protein